MYDLSSTSPAKFNIMEAYNEIAGAAFRFEAEGHLDIWIYLKGETLSFHYVEMRCLSRYFVSHFRCHKVTHGFSNFEWHKLGALLARVYFDQY